jgi:hypothetical protein
MSKAKSSMPNLGGGSSGTFGKKKDSDNNDFEWDNAPASSLALGNHKASYS